jgi:acyl CoA:acetate/3-ketoacid CoA transferase beta subunit
MIMDHSDILGNPKLVKTCSLPLTGQRVVQRAITNLGVVDIQ